MPVLFCFILFVLTLFSGPATLWAQGQKKQTIQASSGMINYGYQTHVFSQFTGRTDIFGDGNGPASTFANISLQVLELFEDLEMPAGFSYGFEVARFSQDSQSVYTGKGDVIGPAVNLNSYLWDIVARLYFYDPFESQFQPYIGAAWGWVNGDIHSRSAGFDTRSSFLGIMATQIFGANVMIGERMRIAIELRNLRSKNVSVSNDPFNQGGGQDLTLDFTGTMLNFMGTYRF